MKQNLTLTRNGSNRFCIVLQSETPIDDGTWLKFLLLLNAVVPKIDGRLSAILEEPAKETDIFEMISAARAGFEAASGRKATEVYLPIAHHAELLRQIAEQPAVTTTKKTKGGRLRFRGMTVYRWTNLDISFE